MKIKKIISGLIAIFMLASFFCSCGGSGSGNETLSVRDIVCFNCTAEYIGDDYITVSVSSDVEHDGVLYFSQGSKVNLKGVRASRYSAGNYLSVTFDADSVSAGSSEVMPTSVTKLLEYDKRNTTSVIDGENYVQTSPILSQDVPKLAFLKNDDENSEFTACENTVLYNGITVYGESPLMTTGYGYAKKTEDFKFVTLKFEKQPDSYTVRGWKEECIGNKDDALKAVNIESENNIINLDGEEVVFEITASWNSGDKIIYSLYVGEAG